MLTLDEFWAATGEHLCGERLHVERDTELDTDLGLDSLDMVELLMTVEDLGAPVPVDVAVSFATVGDLYDHYVTSLSALERS